jgi:hypothetical protein
MAAGVYHQLFRRRIRLSVSVQWLGQRGARAARNPKQGDWLTPGTLLPPLEQRDCPPVAKTLFRKHLHKPPPRLNSDLKALQ